MPTTTSRNDTATVSAAAADLIDKVAAVQVSARRAAAAGMPDDLANAAIRTADQVSEAANRTLAALRYPTG